MRAGLIAVAVIAGCASPTECERTGVCVTIAGDGTSVTTTPPLFVDVLFDPPVPDPTAISSSFGPRWKQSAGRDDFHLGIDYFGELGTPLFAVGDGVVKGVYPAGSSTFPLGGNVVVIEHAIPETTFQGQRVDRVYAVYLHCNEVLVGEGESVTAGDEVATMGKTGDTDFVHLHFETRVQTTCSLVFQRENHTCETGFDPHVHPFVFVGEANDDLVDVMELESDAGFAVRFFESRRDLDLDVIETDFGTIGFTEREGIDVEWIDDFDYGYMRLVPQPFLSTSAERVFDLHFADRPSYLELRDIHGNGVRF
jgi:hypothetical protein